MDNIFTLIVIIIAIVSVIGKLKPKQETGKNAKPKAPAGWIAKLNAFLEEVQKSSREPVEDGDIGASQWRVLMEKDTAGIPQSDDRQEDLGDLEFVEPPSPPKAKPASGAARARAGLPERMPVVPDAPSPASKAPEISRSSLSVSRADLRRAIVWSEILGPPVALKDLPGGRNRP